MESKPEFQGEDDTNTSVPEVEVVVGVANSTLESTTGTQSEVEEIVASAPSVEEAATAEVDWEDHKLIAIVGYIFPILFFVPLVQEESKKSVYAKFHAGQQLNVLIVFFGIYLLSGVFMTMFFSLGIILAIFQLIPLALFVFAVINAVSASKGEMKELPIIGKYHLLK